MVQMIMKTVIDYKERKLIIIDGSNEWYTPIFDYLKYGIFLEYYTKGSCDHLQNLVAKYTILANVLYRRSFDGIFLRCLKKTEIPITLEQTHEGICGGYFRGRPLAQKLICM